MLQAKCGQRHTFVDGLLQPLGPPCVVVALPPRQGLPLLLLLWLLFFRVARAAAGTVITSALRSCCLTVPRATLRGTHLQWICRSVCRAKGLCCGTAMPAGCSGAAATDQ